MAHKILGIDLGAWSVKVAELEAGFRQTKLLGLYEKRLLPADAGESDALRGARTAAALIAEQELSPEMCATSMGGDATLRLISLPFADAKKIEQVLGYELESQILGELDQLVYDSVISTVRPDGANVIAVAMERERIKERIAVLQQFGAEPRVIGAAALSYAALRGYCYFSEGDDAPPLMIVDIGHRHTHVCIVRGERVLFARSIYRGGEDVTNAVIETFRMTPEDAERSKHDQAFIAPPGAPPQSPSHRRVDDCMREAVRPLVRELKQTLSAHRAVGAPAPARVLVTGGGARLQGLPEHLSHELGLPLEALHLVEGETVPLELLSQPLAAQALGLALAAAAPVPQVNLRRGELAYRTDYSYLRGKIGYLAAAVLTLLALAAVNAAASLRGLRKEAEALETRLKQETVELFGEARLDGKAVSEELRNGPRGGPPPAPTTTAYDVLDEISRHVPAGDKLKLDVLELDIKPKKVYLKATAESAQQVDDLVAALEKIDCFEKVEKGKVAVVTARPSGENPKNDPPVEMKQFTLTINTTCP